MRDIVERLAAEQNELDSLLATLDENQWRLPTPAAGWDVRDQIAHLADTEELAHDTATGGPRQLNEEAATHASPEAFTESGCEKGRAMTPAAVRAWWADGAARTRAALLTFDPKQRIPWGLGMSARSFATARLMETWAHGLDVRAAVGKPPNLTERLRDVAWLVSSALPYAFMRAGRQRPDGSLRVVLTPPPGIGAPDERWTYGPDDATDSIEGDAGEFCILGVQRMRRADAKTLTARGPLAEASLDVLRAFL